MLAAAISPAMAGVKKIGTIHGIEIYRIKTMGVFCPSTTTIVTVNTNVSGTLFPLNDATSPGVLAQIAEAGGNVGAAFVRRPDRTRVNNGSSSDAAAGAGASSTATGGNGNGGAGGSGGQGGNGGNHTHSNPH